MDHVLTMVFPKLKTKGAKGLLFFFLLYFNVIECWDLATLYYLMLASFYLLLLYTDLFIRHQSCMSSGVFPTFCMN